MLDVTERLNPPMSAPAWECCPHCGLLHPCTTACTGRLYTARPADTLPRWPLAVLLVLAQVVLAGAVVAAVWWMWQ